MQIVKGLWNNSFAFVAFTEHKQRYIDHSSNEDMTGSNLHASEKYPQHRYRKQNILRENPSKRGKKKFIALFLGF